MVDEEVTSNCENKKDITKVSDTLVLYHDASEKITEGIGTNSAITDQFYETFCFCTECVGL